MLIGPSPCFLNDLPHDLGRFEREDLERLLARMDQNDIGWAQHLAPVVAGADGTGEAAGELSDSFCSTEPMVARVFAHTTFFADDRCVALPDTGDQWRGCRRGAQPQAPCSLQAAALVWRAVSAIDTAPGSPGRCVSVFSDDTERWRNNQRLSHLALHDPLTDLQKRGKPGAAAAPRNDRVNGGSVAWRRNAHLPARHSCRHNLPSSAAKAGGGLPRSVVRPAW